MRVFRFLTVCLVMVSLVACDDSPPLSGGGVGGKPVPLPIIPTIHAKIADYKLRQEPIVDVVETLKEEELAALERRYTCVDTSTWTDTEPVESFVMESAAGEGGGSLSDGRGQFSFTDTNNQEAAVHEGDVVKVRGEHAYVLRSDRVDVYRIWPATTFGKVDSIAITGSGEMLFADDAHLVVISDVTQAVSYGKSTPLGGYGYNPTRDYRVQVFARTTDDDAKLLYAKDYRGNLLAARRVGSRVALVLRQELHLPASLPFDPYHPDCPDLREAAAQARREHIANSTWQDWVPLSTDDPILLRNSIADRSLLSVIDIAIADEAQDDRVTSVRTRGDTVYASQEAIYVGQKDWTNNRSAIHAFAWGENSVAYRGTGLVDGLLKDSFSLSEFQGTLRVVAGRDYQSHSVITLDATDPHLPMIGGVDNIGVNEKLYAVRFMGPRAYAVTFKKVDPLYVIDLEDPTNVQVLGELKIPGYSSYLHPMGRTHLIGVGKDTVEANDPTRDFAWFQGVKLSIFDVSDPSDPRESHKTVVGGRGTDTPVLRDHRAFTYDAQRNLMAVPISLYDDSGIDDFDWGTLQYEGLQLYRVDAQQGMDLIYEYTAGSVERSVIYGDEEKSYMLLIRPESVEQVAL